MFKIAVINKKTGKRSNFLCTEHRYIGNIWYKHCTFKTAERAQTFINTFKKRQPDEYYWRVESTV